MTSLEINVFGIDTPHIDIDVATALLRETIKFVITHLLPLTTKPFQMVSSIFRKKFAPRVFSVSLKKKTH